MRPSTERGLRTYATFWYFAERRAFARAHLFSVL